MLFLSAVSMCSCSCLSRAEEASIILAWLSATFAVAAAARASKFDDISAV